MTGHKAVLISLVVFYMVRLTDILQKPQHVGAALVFLVSVAILVARLRLFTANYKKDHLTLCTLIEIFFANIILKGSIRYIWNPLADYISQNAEGFVNTLVGYRLLEGFICYICSAKPYKCTLTFTNLILQMISFSLFLFTFTFTNLKSCFT